jgi:oligopeptide transport system ATP-binding protein
MIDKIILIACFLATENHYHNLKRSREGDRMERLLEVKDLAISFRTRGGEVQAIRGVSFHVNKGETLAIVGESGSGKSVTSQAVMKLVPQPAGEYKRGQILFDGQDLIGKNEKQMQKIRGKEIGMIFQDPMTSLNPMMKVGRQITEVLFKHEKISKEAAYKRGIELLNLVGIPSPERRFQQYPHEFSGGMRQRVVIAMALAANPKLLIADEPTTALDVTIQAQILDLMKDLQKKIDTAIIFITHDLGVVARMADRVAVMYAGQIVEMGTAEEIFYDPRHPYTWGLLASMPSLESKGSLLTAIPGTPPDLIKPPKGDAFALRSTYAMAIDMEKEPPMYKVSDTHLVKSWLMHPMAPVVEPPDVVKKQRRVLSNAYSEPVLVENSSEY